MNNIIEQIQNKTKNISFLNEPIKSYAADAYYVFNFIFGNISNGNKEDLKMSKTLRNDTMKCVFISNILFLSYVFSKGRQHYFTYIQSFIKSVPIGLGYSVYFTNQKLLNYQARKQAEVLLSNDIL